MATGVGQFVRARAGLIRWTAAALFVLAVVLFARVLPVERLRLWLSARSDALGAAGPVLLTVVFVAAVLLLLPATPFGLFAGAAYGILGGAAVNFIASTASAVAGFWIARLAARGPVARAVGRYPRLRAAYAALGGPHAWKVVVAVRVAHAGPLGLQNYFFGISPIRFRTFLLAGGAATLPAAFLYSYLGFIGAEALAEVGGGPPAGPVVWAWRAAGLLLAGAAALYVVHVARRAIKQAAADESDSGAPAGADGPLGPDAPRGWPWAALAALAGSALLLAAAAWSFAEQEQVRRALEQWLS
jgi:uncharacterized membrane protein YdjX (TVP38/TMEM64 family)